MILYRETSVVVQYVRKPHPKVVKARKTLSRYKYHACAYVIAMHLLHGAFAAPQVDSVDAGIAIMATLGSVGFHIVSLCDEIQKDHERDGAEQAENAKALTPTLQVPPPNADEWTPEYN